MEYVGHNDDDCHETQTLRSVNSVVAFERFVYCKAAYLDSAQMLLLDGFSRSFRR